MSKPNSPWSIARFRRVTTTSHRYIAEVDGLRFIAIFSVILFHVSTMLAFYADPHRAHSRDLLLAPSRFDFLIWPVTHGYRGVYLFFVISGFILGIPFAAHYLANAPAVKVGRFYLRRLTRLEPPYILALLLLYGMAVLTHSVHTHEPGFYSGLPLRLAYAYGLVRGEEPKLDPVTWTLEIEVQFYLLAPILALVFKLATAHRRCILILAICAGAVLGQIAPSGSLTLLCYAQYFLTGFLLADLYCTNAWGGRLPLWGLDVLGLSGLLVTALLPETFAFSLLLPWCLFGVFVAALRGNLFRRFLGIPLISVLGGMCYSLYLLHSPVLSTVVAKLIPNGLSLPEAYFRLAAIGVPAAVTVGFGYYILIERPCMIPNWPQLMVQFVSRKINGTLRRGSPLPGAVDE